MPQQVKDITIQEIDDFISENNLDPRDRFMFRILRNNYLNGEKASTHIEDKEIHTPKGLLLRGQVIAWAVFIVIIISTVVAYLPEKIGMLSLP